MIILLSIYNIFRPYMRASPGGNRRLSIIVINMIYVYNSIDHRLNGTAHDYRTKYIYIYIKQNKTEKKIVKII